MDPNDDKIDLSDAADLLKEHNKEQPTKCGVLIEEDRTVSIASLVRNSKGERVVVEWLDTTDVSGLMAVLKG